MTFKDLTGQRFGRLVVLGRHEAKAKDRSVMWNCACDCGGKAIVASRDLKSGHSKSCGCLKLEKFLERSISHGESKTRLYKIWKSFRKRCYNENEPSFRNYGGRGIKVCDEWNDDFETFRDWALANGYSDDLSIDRIDVNGNYEPANCRWITMREQALNKQDTIYLTYKGETRPLLEWAEIVGVKYDTLHGRIFDYGWDVERALTESLNH